jgi:hypothetical protein
MRGGGRALGGLAKHEGASQHDLQPKSLAEVQRARKDMTHIIHG